ncbi:Pectate lyase superfamily protein [uncultured Caudovirales phage]|uniref:Pectate lyase superfamily protein n=1 Tax=uncultured Caudovirales phage TaxID=2100421 RepID=A0A6J5LZI0_9CAUD|nr:Pectate lyase superfamily protein [uncultured Caudovirales phage]
MAIVQISRITQRKGLQENLPQLAGAEFGWSIDERRLFIGNGTLQEGAPVIGNTEILTEFSDIFEFQTTYTYKGEAAGYIVQTGVTPSSPVTQSLQSWLDQFATVKDFGATGDGVTDDTDAINRALYQLYCREVNPQIRRSLFFPAGVYKVSSTIIIPPFATLVGEGPDNSVIQMATGDDSALRAYVARTGDSLQQTGVNIGLNGALLPQYVTVSNLGFTTLDDAVDVFLVDAATKCNFNNVQFAGPRTTSVLTTDSDASRCVDFNSTPILACNNIVFDRCVFSGTTYGIETNNEIQGITVSNSKFETLYQGITLGYPSPVDNGPTGFRVLHNFFNDIYAEGIIFGQINLNATGYNIFYDVGNHFAGTLNPATPVIRFTADNNISVGDMFERSDDYAQVYQRIELGNTISIGFVNGKQLQMGAHVIQSGQTAVLPNNTTGDLFEFDAANTLGVQVTYTARRDTGVRVGTFRVTIEDGSAVAYDDDYTANEDIGLTLSAAQAASVVTVSYTTTDTNPDLDGSISYSITYFQL